MNNLLQILALFIALAGVCTQAVYANNDLAIGKSAKITGVVNIPILPAEDFNFKPNTQIFSRRKEEVLKHSNLLKSNYTLSEDVFGQILDKRPWWGTLGEAYYGAGQNSIRGLTVQSIFIVNPFLLAAIRATPGLSRQLTESDLLTKNYPNCFPATNLRWWPKEGKAEVTYQISALKNQMCSLFHTSSWEFNGELGLELINARDLGLEYVYIPPTWAYNMKLGSPMRGPIKIPQYLHCGGSCGFPGGCNNMSPATPSLDDVTYEKLPARVVLMMWKNAPATGREPPDMIFTINYN
jgi:hypothetical protein